MSESENTESPKPCVCTEESVSEETLLSPKCECPRDDLGIVIHEQTCLMFRSEKIIYPHDPICECNYPTFEDGKCLCCSCPVDQCRCRKAGREALDAWRNTRDTDPMPHVLESSHPLMQKFQETLKRFLIKENAIAEEEILNLRDELRLSKLSYDRDLETIYRSDHDTNAQRVLIGEYEATLAQRVMEREAAEKRARESNEKYKSAQAVLEEHIIKERETIDEMEALNALCNQLNAWRKETDSDVCVSQRMSVKMQAEKKALADEKRQLDIFLFALNNEVWKLESKLELFKKQIEIKTVEMDKINDKVTSYAAELDELDLDKRRLMSLWNSVLVNIKQRDKVYDTVRDDFRVLQDNYCTLLHSLESTKKALTEEMHKSKEIAMSREKINRDIEHATKSHDADEAKRVELEEQINDMTESIEMTERDQELIKSENQTMRNILKSTIKELDRRTEYKQKLENEILLNLQECLLNDKAVESMANGIRKMQEMSRNKEISLMSMENQHAEIILEIEIKRNRQINNKKILDKTMAEVKKKEDELDAIQEEQRQMVSIITKKQRELDIALKKYSDLKEIFEAKSPQELRIESLERQIKNLRQRTEKLQHAWMRLQGHVVKLADHHNLTVTDINLINKQLQICDQKIMRIQAESDAIAAERHHVDCSLRMLRGRLEVLERTRKESNERNVHAQINNVAITQEYGANLKNAEDEIIQLEDDIEALDKEKMNLTQELDRVQREALIWQRKGILAVELKKNMKSAKSAEGEIGQMRSEIHKMEVRRDQLRRTGMKLAEDLAQYVTRRDILMDKTRAAEAIEKTHGSTTQTTSQISYHHKLRLAKADVARRTKENAEAKAHLEQLQKDKERVDHELVELSTANSTLEKNVADILKETRITDRTKHWLLERVVRAQRFGAELFTAIKRQSARIGKPKETVFEEHALARALNDRLRYIVGVLQNDFPHLEEKLQYIANTLNIFSPQGSPSLTDESTCRLLPIGEFTMTDEEIIEAARQELGVFVEFPLKKTSGQS